MKNVLERADVCLGICFAADCFVVVRAHSGFVAAFMGACWLLAAWVQYLKSNGVDFFRGFRREAREVPYYLRAEKDRKPRLSINGNRHSFDDGLNESADLSGEGASERSMRRANMWAFLIAGTVLLAWSQVAAVVSGHIVR